MQLHSSIHPLADQSWVRQIMSSQSPKRTLRTTLQLIIQLLEWYMIFKIYIYAALCSCYCLSMMDLLLLVFRLSLLRVMLNTKTLCSRQISCSTSYQLTLQQQACWLLRNQPLLLVLRCVLPVSLYTYLYYLSWTNNYLSVLCFNRFESLMMICPLLNLLLLSMEHPG